MAPPKDLNQELNDTTKYISKKDMPELSEQARKDMEKKKKELDKIKNFILKKYKFTLSLGILPPQAVPKIEEEENIPEDEKKDKRTHIVMLIPEEQFKNVNKIKATIVEYTKDIRPKLWFHIITPVDVWNFLMDSRYDLSSAVAMSYPLYDKGLLGAMRVAEVHKSLVIRKFEKYVSSYVIAGSLVRGTATKTSDVDVFIVIDDTDVKRMPRLELKEKLRGMIYNYTAEAQAIAGTKNKLEPQIYLLTEFWEAVKDANPVMVTFIRDGVPLYDRGTFLPWKLLLKMGKIKPSSESIDMFMSSGDKAIQMANRRLMDIMIDLYYSVLNPSQGLLMMYGLQSPTHKETPKVFKDIFYDKEKLIEKKYVATLEKVVGLFKDYEHGKLKEIKGSEIEKIIGEAKDFIKRMKKLREAIEKVSQKNIVKEIDKEVFELLENLFGKKSKKQLIETFEKELVKKSKIPSKMLSVLKDIDKVCKEFKKGKASKSHIENARKNASVLINHLIDYGQRCDLVSIDKARMQIITKDKQRFELLMTDSGAFLIQGMNVRKITDKIQASTIGEFNEALKVQKGKLQTQVSGKVFDVLKAEFGEFEIVI